MGTIPLTSINSPTALRGFKAGQSVWNNWFLKDMHPAGQTDPRKAGETPCTAYRYLWAQLSSGWEPWQPRPTAAPRTPHHSSWGNNGRHIRDQLGHFSPWKELFISLKFLIPITRSPLPCDNKLTLPTFLWIYPAEDRANWHWCLTLGPPELHTSNNTHELNSTLTPLINATCPPMLRVTLGENC